MKNFYIIIKERLVMPFALSIALFTFIVFPTPPAHAHWSSKGPWGGSITCFTTVDTLVYAGTASGGVFRSTDKNLTAWKAVSYTGIKNSIVNALAPLGQSIVAASGSHLYISNDMGNSWALRDNGISTLTIRTLATSGHTIYAGTVAGVYSSADSGKSWTLMNPGSITLNTTSLTVDGQNLYAGTDKDGIFKYDMNSSSWSPMNNGLSNSASLTIRSIAIHTSGDIFIGTNDGIYSSSLSNINWAITNKGLATADIKDLAIVGDSIYAATAHGLYYSATVDLSWNWINNEVTDIGLAAIHFYNDKFIAGSPENGSYIFPHPTAEWRHTITGLNNIRINTHIAFDSVIIASTREGVYVSTDNATSYTLSNNGLDKLDRIFSFVRAGNKVFAGTSEGVYVTTDLGKNWTKANDGIPSGVEISALAINHHDGLFASTADGKVYMSSQGAVSWVDISTGLPAAQHLHHISTQNETTFISTHQNGVYMKEEDKDWVAANTGLPVGVVEAIVVSGEYVYAAVHEKGVYVSEAATIDWKEMNTGLPSKTVTALANLDDTHVLAGYRGGIHVLRNEAENWQAFGFYLFLPEFTDIHSIAFTTERILVGTSTNSLYSNAKQELPSSIAPQAQVQRGSLRIYPNPNSGSFVLDRGNIQGSLKEVLIYDMHGRLMGSFSGNESTFEVHYPAGLYFIQARTASQINTGRVVVE